MLLIGSMAAAACAQGFEPYKFNPFSDKAAGFHVVNASVSGSYSTGAQSLGLGDSIKAPGRGDIGFLQGGIVLGWSGKGEASNVSVIYSPSVARGLDRSRYQSINHLLTVSGNRPIAPRWMFEYSGGLIASDFNLLLASRAPRRFASFDELTAAIVSASAGNFQLADLIAALPFTRSPETSYLYGGRHMSASGTATASFEASSRSQVRMSIYGMRSEVVSREGGDALAALLRRTRSVNGSLGWTYAITPRTFSSVSVSTGRVGSEFNDGLVSHANVSLGRKLNERWYVQVTGGAGSYRELRGATLRKRQFLNEEYAVSVGYKVYAHTLAVNFGRRTGDDFGLGSKTTLTSSAAWTWARPGRSVSMSGNFGYAQLFADDLPGLTSWTSILSVARALHNGFAVSGSYRYVQFPRALFLRSSYLGISGAVGSLSWSPEGR
jgi:hypothetical protein